MPTRNPSASSTRTSEADERAPLLGGHEADHVDHSKITSFPRRHLLLLVCLSVVAADFGNYLGYAPHIEILESIICRQARGSNSFVGNDNCKSPDVQGELALVNGWKDTFDQVPGILLALPYGFAADRIGRKPILALSLTGLILEEISIRLIFSFNSALPLRMVWATPVFQIIGGGPQIATAMAYAMVTDIVPSSQRASVFFILSAATLLGEIIATPVAAFLMSWSPWIPSLLGLFFECLGLLGATFISDIPFNSAPSNDQRDLEEEEESQEEGHNLSLADDPPYLRWKNTIRRQWNHVQNDYLASWSANLFYTVGAFLLASIGRQALQLIVQYASNRFSWSIARASSLIALKGVINLVTLLFILPWLSNWLSTHLLLSPAAKDLRIVQGSVWLLTLGSAIMAVSTYPVTFIVGVSSLAFGWGFYSALRSLAMELVSPSQVGIVNTAIGFAQSIGSLLSGPILAAAFRRGLQEDGVLVGLPYMVAAGLFFLSGCLSACIRIPRGITGA
ncbi:Major facilitator superfamily domain general substrate transporter [Penicillium cf. griseofulvum]|uniref:Major facilitator superfamily domain general substrate transporter n=1 Tax=Penicillium cf. griseofulvum TaxID=2972120 RepID=A0A9W9M3B2_9EURO|nr:Major facilitator superfamily domain general substrate transporter [Penicillium cf. griseofulvum]KAJ5422958.1 Major facilitator superfamily domain general substrate transporter [Penicillium cf. griseofulvum]KAJ5433826.1 Major facilitator superfamily domain general substrate transporter [Penicillium cf. griseofulvum]